MADLSDTELSWLWQRLVDIDEAGIDEAARSDSLASYRVQLVQLRGGGSARVMRPLVDELKRRRAADLERGGRRGAQDDDADG